MASRLLSGVSRSAKKACKHSSMALLAALWAYTPRPCRRRRRRCRRECTGRTITEPAEKKAAERGKRMELLGRRGKNTFSFCSWATLICPAVRYLESPRAASVNQESSGGTGGRRQSALPVTAPMPAPINQAGVVLQMERAVHRWRRPCNAASAPPISGPWYVDLAGKRRMGAVRA